MSWQQIEGHDAIADWFRKGITAGRMASSFLFLGPPGVGKRMFATALAKALLCTERADELLEACGTCPSCVQVAAGSHPDLLKISKPKERSYIPVALLIGEGDRRMREGLCHDISLKPFMGRRKIAIIDDADFLNIECANSLLKTLEEPPGESMLILIGTSAEKQLPTIRSRCQQIRFSPLSPETIGRLLVEKNFVEDAEFAQCLADHCAGSMTRAIELADPALWEFRLRLHDWLSQEHLDCLGITTAIGAFVDEAGREASARRARLRQVIGLAVEFYRQLMRVTCGAEMIADSQLAESIDRALSHANSNSERAETCLARSLDALGHIDRNANQATLIQAWIFDLGC